MSKAPLLNRFKLSCIKYLYKKGDGRDRISSAEEPVFNTYWIYLIEAISKEEKQSRDSLKELGEVAGPEEERRLIVDSVSQGKVFVRQQKEDEDAPDNKAFELKPQNLSKYRFEIRFFLRETEEKYASPVLAAFHRFTKWSYAKLIIHRYNRWSANQSIRLLQERIRVLETMIRIEDSRGPSASNRSISPWGLMGEIYGPKVSLANGSVSLPAFKNLCRILDSLAYTGELEKVQLNYRTTGKALATVFEYNDMVKRHREARNRDLLMLAATTVIAVAAFIEGYQLLHSMDIDVSEVIRETTVSFFERFF